MELAKRVVHWHLLIATVLAVIVTWSYKSFAAEGTSAHVLYEGQTVIVPPAMWCNDRPAGMQLAAAYSAGGARSLSVVFNRLLGDDRCGSTLSFFRRIGKQVYSEGPLNVIEVVDDDGHVLFYLITDFRWKPVMGT